MPAYLKMDPLKGEATDDQHKEWIIIQSLSAPIFRSIPQGAKDQQRTKGETVLGDCVVVRQIDKSSTKLMEACAQGTFFKEVEIHLCTTVKNKQEPYLKYKLSDAIITTYQFHGNADGSPIPTEEFTINFTKGEWTYVTVDPKTGDPKGNVVGKYEPGAGKS